MSRVIKFRAWEGRAMIEPYCELKDSRFWGEDLVNTGYHDPVAVMQYTGLKDKNGKEIYEGDVITSKNYIDVPYIIEYVKTGFGVRHPSNRESIYVNDAAWSNMEVIGNIYENPELVGGSK